MEIIINSDRLDEIFALNNDQLYIKTDQLYVKTDQIDDDNRRACVKLDNGHMAWFEEEIFVYKSVAKVVVE